MTALPGWLIWARLSYLAGIIERVRAVPHSGTIVPQQQLYPLAENQRTSVPRHFMALLRAVHRRLPYCFNRYCSDSL